MNQKIIKINSDFIKLDQFLKWSGIIGAGSDAKLIIESGKVLVNDQLELRRGHKLYPGDVVRVGDTVLVISAFDVDLGGD